MTENRTPNQLARAGYGHEDIQARLRIAEYDARQAVFGKPAADAWLRRMLDRHGRKEAS